jgi:hypothetical protein
MTDREKLLALMREFGVEPGTGIDFYGNDANTDEAKDVVLMAHKGNVHGFMGFACYFSFDEHGAFEHVSVVE